MCSRYYDLLLFTKDQDTPLPSLDNINSESLETDSETQQLSREQTEVEPNDDTISDLEDSEVGKKEVFLISYYIVQ